MPIPVPTHPTPDILARYRVNEPASAMHFRSLIQKTNFLRGYVVQPYFSACYPEPSSNYTAATVIPYPILFKPTPGVRVMRVQFETHAHTAGNTGYVDSTYIDGAGASPLTGSDAIFSGSAGATTITATQDRTRKTHVGYFDISGLDPTTVHTFILNYYCVAESKGLSSLSACEVPFAMIDPNGNPTTELGVNEAWPDPRNRIFEGSSSEGAGTQRLIDEVSMCRTRSRHHWQIATQEYVGQTMFRAGAAAGAGVLNYQDRFGTTYDPNFFFRAQRRSSTTENGYKFAARYKWGGAAGTALIRLTITTSDDNWTNTISSSTGATLALANTAGVYAVGEVTMSPGVYLDGAGQRQRITISAITDGNDLDITNLALIEEET